MVEVKVPKHDDMTFRKGVVGVGLTLIDHTVHVLSCHSQWQLITWVRQNYSLPFFQLYA